MPERDKQGMYAPGNYQYVKLLVHASVNEWLKDRPEGTRIQYGSRLYNFCKDMNLTPEQFQELDKFEARNLVWKYVISFKGEKPREAEAYMAALKSFYRSKDGVTLPFDSRRGGKHHIKKVKKKAKYEIIPDKEQTYRLVDGTTSLRDRALFLVLFQSGIRVNAACSLNVGHVRDQLFPTPQVPLVLKITDDLDSKLRGAEISFYITGLQGEAVEALKNYVAKRHKDSADDTPLFITRRKTRIGTRQVWMIVKKAARRAGLDAKRIWTHSLRKAFRKVVRRANIDGEHKESLMGHALEGSRESYYDRYAVEEIMEEYMKIDFAREVPGNNAVTKLRKQLEDEQGKRMMNEMRLEKLERELESIRKLLREMLEKKN